MICPQKLVFAPHWPRMKPLIVSVVCRCIRPSYFFPGRGSRESRASLEGSRRGSGSRGIKEDEGMGIRLGRSRGRRGLDRTSKGRDSRGSRGSERRRIMEGEWK